MFDPDQPKNAISADVVINIVSASDLRPRGPITLVGII